LNTYIQYAIFGLGTGAVYALVSQGLIVIYRGSGVLNFAHGGIAAFAAYSHWQLNDQWGVGWWPSFLVVLVGSGVAGLMISEFTIRPLRNPTALARVVVTLGVLALIQGLGALIWNTTTVGVASKLPNRFFTVGEYVIPEDRLYLVGIALAITVLLSLFYRLAPVGLAVRANAENSRAASALGWSPRSLGNASWVLGCTLAGAAGMLIAPLTGLEFATMSQIILPTIAAALIGRFESFFLTFVGAIAIGIMQAVTIVDFGSVQGASYAIPFLIIVVLLLVRGKGIPIRGDDRDGRLPEVGTGIVRPRVIVPLAVLLTLLVFTVFPQTLVDAVTVSLCWAIILLSVVVLLGLTNQLSFEQMAMAGLAALIAARLVDGWNFPFALAFVAGIAAAVPIGVLFAIPALRTRGIVLAVVTLGLGLVIYQMILQAPYFKHGDDGTPVGPQELFGIPIDSARHPERYAVVVLVVFVLCAIACANVRRGRAGSALIAVRNNERAAAALGVNVFATKVFAFTLGAAVAAAGGIMLAFRDETINYYLFDPFNSILAVSYAVIGSVAFISGPLFGAPLVAGGIGGWILHEFWPHASLAWLTIIGGLSVIVVLLQDPDGLGSMQLKVIRHAHPTSKLAYLRPEILVLTIFSKIKRVVVRRPTGPTVPESLPDVVRARVRPATLEVEGVTVRYGGVTALADASIKVAPGEIVGLIGPNGAGKTTLIDAVTGFVKPAAGVIRLDGVDITGRSVHRRVAAGMSRSFQSLELLEQMTVRENLRVASDRRDALGFALDIIAPSHRPLSAAAVAAVRDLELEDELDKPVEALSYGHRRLAAIARALAVDPSILLLDEPVAGLSSHESEELATIVVRLAREWGIGILLVEHEMPFVMRVCDRIAVLDFGRQIAVGTPAEVTSDPDVIAAYLGEESEDRAPLSAAEPAH
jgi:ABC-type branched-subunit amino acid transport system ATPase component/branched-subunit amino acid ABC-type transport system permease component